MAEILPLDNVEILHPIIPESVNNVRLFQMDTKEWKGVQKSETLWQHEIITMSFKIIKASDNMSAFYQFLEDNAGKLVILNTPGVQPFLRSSESNNHCYILKFSDPLREMQNTYSIQITFLWQPTPA